MEPRLRDRRVAVRRGAGLRRLNVLVYAGMFAVVLLVAAALSRTPLVDVDAIVVEGATSTSAEEVVRGGGIGRGDAMIDLDLGAAARRVASLPWVRRVTVARSWPGTVEYRIEEWDPVAVVATGDGVLFYVGPERHLLGPVSTRPGDLVELRGVSTGTGAGEGVGAEAPEAVEVASALPGDLVALLPVLAVDVNGELVLGRTGGGEIRLGDAERLDEKLVAVRTVLEGADLGCLASLDVRVPAAPVISRAC